MSGLRSLLPYALTSVGIVLASAIAVGSSVREAPLEASARPTQRAELSETGRMTYWKGVSNTEQELWVSDLDGRRAWPLVREPATLEIALTRWSTDGSSVAYIRGNTSIVVASVDGSGSVVLQVPRALLSTDLRIIGYSLSPSAKWIALALQQLGPRTRPSDVYVVEVPWERRRKESPDGQPLPLVGAPPWTRVTDLGDAHSGRWISESELFIETRGGMIARLNRETREIWPVSGMRATSPMLGGDGRLYFAGGAWVHADAAGGPWANGGIWSASLDGSDARNEADRHLESFRLLGRLSDGRFVVASPGSTYLVGQQLIPTPWQAGTIRRVIVPASGSDAIGITDSRVVRMFASKIPDSNASVAPPEAVSMLLDGVRDADVWFPPAKAASLPAPSPVGGPAARLAFVIGTTLFEASTSGSLRAVVSAPPGGWLGQPLWSPTGDRIAVVVGRPEEQPNSTLIVFDASGELWRSANLRAPSVSWSPDGSQVAVSQYGEIDTRSTLVLDARSGATVTTHTGVMAQWTTRGLMGLDSGVIDPTQQRFRQWIDNSVLLLGDTGRRRITDARTLSAHPLLADVPGPGLPAWISQLDASPDGELIGIWLYRIGGGGFSHGAFVVVDATGEPQWVDPFEPRSGMQDLSWSPTSAAVGMTLVAPDARQPWIREAGSTARVVSGRTGAVLLEQPGAFAGWSTDGDWVYVGRPEGLFAYPLAGGDAVRVGPFGVRVYATRP